MAAPSGGTGSPVTARRTVASVVPCRPPPPPPLPPGQFRQPLPSREAPRSDVPAAGAGRSGWRASCPRPDDRRVAPANPTTQNSTGLAARRPAGTDERACSHRPGPGRCRRRGPGGASDHRRPRSAVSRIPSDPVSSGTGIERTDAGERDAQAWHRCLAAPHHAEAGSRRSWARSRKPMTAPTPRLSLSPISPPDRSGVRAMNRRQTARKPKLDRMIVVLTRADARRIG